ncbi:MAG: YcxB family protein [candidate division Zixibacteria bacterium]
MPEKIEIDVTLTKSEIARYNFYHIRWLLILDILGLIGLLIITYASMFHPEPQTRDFLGSLILWAVLILAFGLSQPFILFLQIYVLKNPAMTSQTASRIYTFSDDGIHINSGGRLATTPWSRVTALKDIGRLILIFTGAKLAYVVPRRCFSSNEQRKEFMGFLLRKIKGAE